MLISRELKAAARGRNTLTLDTLLDTFLDTLKATLNKKRLGGRHETGG